MVKQGNGTSIVSKEKDGAEGKVVSTLNSPQKRLYNVRRLLFTWDARNGQSERCTTRGRYPVFGTAAGCYLTLWILMLGLKEVRPS